MSPNCNRTHGAPCNLNCSFLLSDSNRLITRVFRSCLVWHIRSDYAQYANIGLPLAEEAPTEE